MQTRRKKKELALGMTRMGIAIAVVGLFVSSAVSCPQSAEPEKREKVAEGRYEAVIQREAEKGQYAEDWVLYRVPTGFLVEAEVRVRDSKERYYVSHLYWLDTKMALTRWEMQLRESPAQDRGELSREVFGCELAPEELRCWIGTETGSLRVSGPYGLVPVAFPSSWFAASWVRAARIGSGMEEGRLKTVVWDMGDGPDDLVLAESKVVELGREKFTAAGAEFNAEKVRIVWLSEQGEESPGFVAWLTAEGVPLAFQWEFPEESQPLITKLVRYKKYSEFGPGR